MILLRGLCVGESRTVLEFLRKNSNWLQQDHNCHPEETLSDQLIITRVFNKLSQKRRTKYTVSCWSDWKVTGARPVGISTRAEGTAI